MKKTDFYICMLLAFGLCFTPAFILSCVLIKHINESVKIFVNCENDSIKYLDHKDCLLCCQRHTEFKMNLQVIKRDFVSFENPYINLVAANFYGVSGPVLFLFFSPALQLIIGIIHRDKFYLVTGFSSLAVLYVGLMATVVYMFATWDGS